MISLVKVISSMVKDGHRLVKVLRYGKDDVQEVDEATTFGTDARAPKDWIAVYAETSTKDEPVVIGYLNKKQLSAVAVGDHKIYSTSEDGGDVKFYMWMKNDGTAEIGGDADHMVRYSKLETAFNQLKDDHNALVQKWDAFCSIYSPGGPSVVGLPATLASSTVGQSSADISPAKINEIKTL